MTPWELAEYHRQLEGGEREPPSPFAGYSRPFSGGSVVDEYVYEDKDGNPYLKVRRHEPKSFSQQHWAGGKWVTGKPPGPKIPYRLPQLLAAAPEEPIFVCEGEKDADAVAGLGLISTCASEGAGNWTIDLDPWFQGRKFINVVADNDEAGRAHALLVARQLARVADEVRIIDFPELSVKGDVFDWIASGGTKEKLLKLANATPRLGHRGTTITAAPFDLVPPEKIPRRRWLYRPHYVGSYISLTVAAGGAGKSSLAIVETLAMVTGKPLLGVKPAGKLRVWYINLEDPYDELQRRFAAACIYYAVNSEQIGGRLFVNSGRDTPVTIATETKRGVTINTPLIHDLIKTVQENEIDVVIVDPFVASHMVTENDNGKIDQVARSWARIADMTGCAVMLVHHLRKTGGEAGTVDDGRGASALLAAARSARVLNVMTKEEASRIEMPEKFRRRHFRADVGKGNLALPPDEVEWYRMETIELGNSEPADLFDGDSVGVATIFNYPKAEPLNPSAEQIEAVRKRITAGRWRLDPRSTKEPWVGIAVGQELALDLNSPVARRAVQALIQGWLTIGYLARSTQKDSKREDREYVEPGPTSPFSHAQGR